MIAVGCRSNRVCLLNSVCLLFSIPVQLNSANDFVGNRNKVELKKELEKTWKIHIFCRMELIGYHQGINFNSFVCTPFNTESFSSNRINETETESTLRNAKTFAHTVQCMNDKWFDSFVQAHTVCVCLCLHAFEQINSRNKT